MNVPSRTTPSVRVLHFASQDQFLIIIHIHGNISGDFGATRKSSQFVVMLYSGHTLTARPSDEYTEGHTASPRTRGRDRDILDCHHWRTCFGSNRRRVFGPTRIETFEDHRSSRRGPGDCRLSLA